jgi:hypothetical protein
MEVVNGAAALAVEEIGRDHVDAVILTGSTARGEETVLECDGRPVVCGDLEFLVITRRRRGFRQARRRLQRLGSRASELGWASGLRPAVEFVPAGTDYLRRLPPSIFGYDLKAHGRVVWGRPSVLDDIPDLKAADIPPHDALRMMLNRLIELTLIEEWSAGALPFPFGTGYQVVKTYLDLAGATLVLGRRYTSWYSARPLALERLLGERADLCGALGTADDFLQAARAAAECKLHPRPEALARFASRGAVAQASAYAWKLWLWGARRWYRSSSSEAAAIVAAYVAHERLVVRMRGWLKYWWHPLRPPGRTSWRRASKLLLRASPQTLAYAAAVLGILARNASRPDLARGATSLLPVHGTGDPVRDAAHLWQWLVRNN